jgi:hypothetical protein
VEAIIRLGEHTISRSTSPAVNVSPSAFFQEAIPPSVMVGLMAGMENLVRACLRADMCISMNDVSCREQHEKIRLIRRERTRTIEEEAIVTEGANARCSRAEV